MILWKKNLGGEEIYINNKLEYVNKYRKKIQDDLIYCIKKYNNIDYFDMTLFIEKENILLDQYHFNFKGQKILTDFILNYINKNI